MIGVIYVLESKAWIVSIKKQTICFIHGTAPNYNIFGILHLQNVVKSTGFTKVMLGRVYNEQLPFKKNIMTGELVKGGSR